MAGINDTSDDEDAGQDSRVSSDPRKDALIRNSQKEGADDSSDPDPIEIIEERPSRGARDDERLSASQRADEGEEGDDGRELTEDERREQNRERRRQAKIRRARAIQRDKTELTFLLRRNEELEKNTLTVDRRIAAMEVSHLDDKIANEEARLAQANELLVQAREDNNGADAVRLEEIRDRVKDRIKDFKGKKEQFISTTTARLEAAGRRVAAVQDEGAGGDDAPHPVVANNASVFMRKNSWFKPKGDDQDSKVALAVDAAVLADGFDPKTRDYWEEVEERLKKVLPHRFRKNAAAEDDYDGDDDLDLDADDEDDLPPVRRRESNANGNGQGAQANGKNGKNGNSRGPRLPSGGSGRNGQGGKKFYLSPARKQALVDAGIWEDPILRNKYAKRYMEWDRENPNS